MQGSCVKSTGSTLPCPRSKVNHWDAAQMNVACRLPEDLRLTHSVIQKESNTDFLNAVHSKSVSPQILPGHPCFGAGVSTLGLSCGKNQFPRQLTAYPDQTPVQRHANIALTTLLRALVQKCTSIKSGIDLVTAAGLSANSGGNHQQFTLFILFFLLELFFPGLTCCLKLAEPRYFSDQIIFNNF